MRTWIELDSAKLVAGKWWRIAMGSIRVAITLLMLSGLWGIAVPSVGGVDRSMQQEDPEGTITALKTRVAELEAQTGDEGTAEPTLPTPTLVPFTGTPVATGFGASILYYYFVERDSGGVVILGEMVNESDQVITAPHFRLALYDEGGNVFGSVDLSPVFPVIQPGERVPFEGAISDDIELGEWQVVEITACETYSGDIDDLAGTELSLRDVVEEQRSDEQLVLSGKVFNAGSSPAERAQITATLYRPDGRYAGTGYTIIDVDVPPERTARFTLLVSSSEMIGTEGGDYEYRLHTNQSSGASVYSC